MEHIRSYLLSVITVALICSILSSLPAKTSTLRAIRKTLCGIFMSLALISPLATLHLPDIQQYLNIFQADAAEAVLVGESMSRERAAEIIKQQTAAYILDKAETMGVTLEVTVTLCDESPQAPCSVTLSGMVSPYARQRISDLISKDLGIKQEDQHWINAN